MKRWQIILVRVLWSIAAIGLIVLFVYAWNAKFVKKCTAIQIELTGNTTGYLFMDEKEILQYLNEQGIRVGTPVGSINLINIEKSLEAIKWVEHANIYFNNQQELQVKIEQRIPVARIFTVSGNSFYIDKTAQRLPLRQLSVMRLPVFTGFPSDQENLSKPDSVLLNDVLGFALTVQKDSFFLAQMAQVNIEPNGDFEMTPTIGDHTVLFGSVEHLTDKLNRLFTFYKKVWVPSGINAYQVLDLRFDHQVVALKKGMFPIKYAPGAMPFIQMEAMADSVSIADSSKLAKPVMVENKPKIDSIVKVVTPSKTPIASRAAPKKIVKQKSIVFVKKINNKSNNKTLNVEKKSAKAEMPKKTTSNNN